MVNDSVREELALKISPLTKTVRTLSEEKPVVEIPANPAVIPQFPRNHQTSEIMIKNTSPTLIDFQNKNATLPDWRLQLQNSVRKRLDGNKSAEVIQPIEHTMPRRANPSFSGANALETDLQTELDVESESIIPENVTVKNALRRIEESRRKYLPTETQTAQAEQSTVKQFPVTLPSKQPTETPNQTDLQKISTFAKPNIFQFSNESKSEKFDTNKLPPLPLPAKISSSFERRQIEPNDLDLDFDEDHFLEIHKTNSVDSGASGDSTEAENGVDEEEIDDYAPITLRFNAALFDLLICSFLSLILLAPFMLVNGRFFSVEGFFAFLATCLIVMFIYLTTSIGFLGRSFGMRVFSLEIIDVEENDYPTLHQAAVSSSVFLLSLAFGGMGFLTMLLNREKRAAHDLISGTIIVREY